MNERLKVSDFYRNPSTISLIEILNLSNSFFLKDWLFVTTTDNPFELCQFDLTSKQKITTISMPQKELAGIEQIEGRLCLFFKNKQELWIYHKQKIIKLHSHFAPITSITSHCNQIITGSADITIRRWNVCQQGLVQDSKIHILTGHTNTISCFLSVSECLLSASKDRSVILWRGAKQKGSKTFQSQVASMIHCKQSQQLAFVESSNKVWILSQRALVYLNKIQTVRMIQLLTINPIRTINQIDFSFLQIVGDNQIEIAQINIGTTMAKICLDKKETKESQILASKCIRRLSLFAISNQGLSMISF